MTEIVGRNDADTDLISSEVDTDREDVWGARIEEAAVNKIEVKSDEEGVDVFSVVIKNENEIDFVFV